MWKVFGIKCVNWSPFCILDEYPRASMDALTVVYIQKDLTLGYTAQTLNFFYSHSFFNVGLTHYFFFEEHKVFLTHTRRKGRKFFKKTYDSVYPKGLNF